VEKVGLILVAGVAAFFISERISTSSKTGIVLGFTDHSVSHSDELALNYETQIADLANNLLGGYGSYFQFGIKIIEKPYWNLITALIHDRVDIAFVSPYTYIVYKYCSRNTRDIDPTRLIGYKYHTSGLYYRSGFLYKTDTGHRQKSIDDLLCDRKLKVILSDEELSTSTFVLPRFKLLAHIEPKIVEEAELLSRSDMVGRIINSDLKMETVIGAFSTEDWKRLSRSSNKDFQKNLGFVELETPPIPHDPVLVNEPYWKRRFGGVKDFYRFITRLRFLDIPWVSSQAAIKNALRSSVYIAQNDSDWINLNQVFVDYLASGVVSKIGSNLVYFPTEDEDLYGQIDSIKRSSEVKVCLVTFQANSDGKYRNTKLEYPVSVIVHDEGSLKKSSKIGRYELDIKGKLHTDGDLHILLKSIVEKRPKYERCQACSKRD
jgi:hypothetical protein